MATPGFIRTSEKDLGPINILSGCLIATDEADSTRRRDAVEEAVPAGEYGLKLFQSIFTDGAQTDRLLISRGRIAPESTALEKEIIVDTGVIFLLDAGLLLPRPAVSAIKGLAKTRSGYHLRYKRGGKGFGGLPLHWGRCI